MEQVLADHILKFPCWESWRKFRCDQRSLQSFLEGISDQNVSARSQEHQSTNGWLLVVSFN